MKFLCLLYFLILSFFSFSQSEKYTFSQPKMGSPLTITMYASDSSKASYIAKEAYKIVDSLNIIYSDYIENSELNELSKKAGINTFTKVSSALWEMLNLSIKAAQQSKGAYDITIGSIVKLWRKARKEKIFPEENNLKNALKAVGYQSIILDSTTQSVKLLNANTQLDVGGIGKGYVAQVVLNFCKSKGIERVLVDAGGKLAMVTQVDKPWKIGITIPNSEELIPLYLRLQNQAVATSGNRYQFVEIGGKKYSHIVNPRTGLGLTHQRNVTAIAPDGATADWLATACSVLSVRRALRLIESMPNCALFMAEMQKGKLKMWQSKRFKPYLEK